MSNRRLTVLVGLADVELASGHADRIIVLTEGRLVFDGPPAREDAARWLSTAVHRDVHRPVGRPDMPAPGRDAGFTLPSSTRNPGHPQ